MAAQRGDDRQITDGGVWTNGGATGGPSRLLAYTRAFHYLDLTMDPALVDP